MDSPETINEHALQARLVKRIWLPLLILVGILAGGITLASQSPSILLHTINSEREETTQVFPNQCLCKALLDRITDKAHTIETGRDSFRFWRTIGTEK